MGVHSSVETFLITASLTVAQLIWYYFTLFIAMTFVWIAIEGGPDEE